MFTHHHVTLDQPFLSGLARLLLDMSDAGDPAGLSGTLVVLPAKRACDSLRHVLLEAADRPALLLPGMLTPRGLVNGLGDRLPGLAPASLPGKLRAAVLAAAITGEPWLRDHPEAAPGMAEELIRLFDELRRHGLDPAVPDAPDESSPMLDQDLERVRRAWRLYRMQVERDDVDRELAILAAVEGGAWPGPPLRRLVVAGFAEMTPATARLLRVAARAAGEGHVVTAAAEGAATTARDFLATFSDGDAPTHPARPPREAVALLAGGEPPETGRDERPFAERLAGRDPSPDTATPELVPCPDPESEGREVAARVVRALRETPGAAVGVATNDRGLARRIVAQLRDAGLDMDDTGGAALSTLPEGRLAWQLLRAVITDWHHEPLLEVLTHPLVTLGASRKQHSRRTLLFEREIRRDETGGATLAGLLRRARDREERLREIFPTLDPLISGLLTATMSALAPLGDGRSARSHADHVAALRAAWATAAPDHPLTPDPEVDRSSGEPGIPPARAALAVLLDDLAAASPLLPTVPLDDFAATLSRLLGKELVRPHRSVFLPVQVTGLLEARLERYDLLILAGLSEDSFPGRQTRPLLPGQQWRRRMGLADWRRRLGEQADLFLRLLHNAPRVVATWPLEKDGQPALPSPMISRLLLARDRAPAVAPLAPLYRREAPDHAAIAASQAAFRAEPAAPAALAPTRPLPSISHTALAVYRNCPYRFLLEKGFGLRETDTVLEELRPRDTGVMAHDCMKDFLQGPGAAALAAGECAAARKHLERAAERAFGAGEGELPQRRLWQATFLRAADAVVDFELARTRSWRPAAVEADFSFPLADLRDWIADPASPPLSDDEAAVTIRGRIDRVDQAVDGAAFAVIDYKTGSLPTAREVGDGRHLQLQIYALALLLGGVDDLPTATGAVEGAFYGLRVDGVGFKIEKPHLAGDHDLRRDAAEIMTLARAMLRRDHDFPLVPEARDEMPDPGPCAYCPFRGTCRLDEKLAEAGVGEVGA